MLDSKFVYLKDLRTIFGDNDVEDIMVEVPVIKLSCTTEMGVHGIEVHSTELFFFDRKGLEHYDMETVYYVPVNGDYDGRTHTIRAYKGMQEFTVDYEWARCEVDRSDFPKTIQWERVVIQRPYWKLDVIDVPQEVLNSISWREDLVGGRFKVEDLGHLFDLPNVLGVYNVEEGEYKDACEPNIMGICLFVKPINMNFVDSDNIGFNAQEINIITRYLA